MAGEVVAAASIVGADATSLSSTVVAQGADVCFTRSVTSSPSIATDLAVSGPEPRQVMSFALDDADSIGPMRPSSLEALGSRRAGPAEIDFFTFFGCFSLLAEGEGCFEAEREDVR